MVRLISDEDRQALAGGNHGCMAADRKLMPAVQFRVAAMKSDINSPTL
jgi:hypothetical protein